MITNSFSTTTDWAETLTAEALSCGLLSKAFYVYPEKGWLQTLADEEVFAESPLGESQPDVRAGLVLLQNWSRSVHGEMSKDAFDTVRADYTRLFIGPAQILTPPWESVFFSQERLTFQEQTLQVRAWYARFGLVVEKLHNEPDDHIGLELAFMAHLSQYGLNALEAQDENSLNEILTAQREFMSQHLLRWGPAWCAQVEAQARTDFYRGIARLTRGALAEIATLLQVAGQA